MISRISKTAACTTPTNSRKLREEKSKLKCNLLLLLIVIKDVYKFGYLGTRSSLSTTTIDEVIQG